MFLENKVLQYNLRWVPLRREQSFFPKRRGEQEHFQEAEKPNLVCGQYTGNVGEMWGEEVNKEWEMKE